MVILMNFKSNPFKVEYTKGNKTFVKTINGHNIVAMKQLNVSDQISNTNALVRQGITIWDYERGTFVHRNTGTPTGATSLHFAFIGNNVKSNKTILPGYSGTTTMSSMTFTVNNVPASTVFGITTSANTVMANGTISATTIGNNTFVSFSGASTTTQNVYGALTASTFSGFGISITGQGATKINTGATITFYVSASTVDLNSPYVYLQRLV